MELIKYLIIKCECCPFENHIPEWLWLISTGNFCALCGARLPRKINSDFWDTI